MILKNFYAVFLARNREFIRDTSSWAWNVIFPVMLVVALTFAFSDTGKVLYKVAVYPSVAQVREASPDFFSVRYIQFVDVGDLEAASVKVERHQFDMLINVENLQYLINETSSKGYILERVLKGSGGREFRKQTVSGKEVRYVDWVMPGVLAMNMMFACLFGVGYVIVRYRKNGVLKRLKATPLSALEFLSAQIASRLWLIVGITAAVFAGTDFFLDFTMYGSYLNLFLLCCLGAASLISMGLIVAARTASEELAGGLLNLISWPMMLLSGVWFSMEGSHPYLQKLSLALPLTHIIEGARAIMIDGAGLLDIWVNILVLIMVTILFLVLGSWLFRWDQS